MNGQWPLHIIAARRRRLAIAQTVQEQRDILIASLASDLIRETEQHLAKEAAR